MPSVVSQITGGENATDEPRHLAVFNHNSETIQERSTFDDFRKHDRFVHLLQSSRFTVKKTVFLQSDQLFRKKVRQIDQTAAAFALITHFVLTCAVCL